MKKKRLKKAKATKIITGTLKKAKREAEKTEKVVKKIKKDIQRTAKSTRKIKKDKVKEIETKKAPKKYKKTGKTRYTTKELKHFKEIIITERKLILESAQANMKALVDSESGEYVGDNLTYSTHMAEQGTDEMEREKNYLFVQRDEKYLGYLQEALIRIDQGKYGICIDCIEEPKYLCRTCPLIPKERLELVPITQHCIECKNLRG